MSRVRLGGIVTSLALVAVSGACGGNNNRTADSVPSSSTSRPAGRQQGVAIGHLVGDPLRRSFVNGTEVVTGRKLAVRDALSTDPSGQLVFALDRKLRECTTLSDAKLQLQPAEDVLVAWERGTTVCVTSSDQETVVLTAGTRLRLVLSDPVFTVTIADGRTVVKVDRGFVLVEDTAHPGTRLLASPQQEAILTDGGELQGPAPIEEGTKREAAAVQRARRQFAPLGLSRPDPGDSPALTRAFRVSELNIGRAIKSDSDPFTGRDANAEFVDQLAEQLGRAWKLKVNVVPVDAEAVESSLAAGTVDAVVTDADPSSLGSLATFPLASADRPLWVATDNGDPALRLALERFVAAIAANQDYEAAYERAYGGTPDYDVLIKVLIDAGVAPPQSASE